MVEFFK